MQDYFLWNGVDCRQYGIHVSEHPPITFPAERSTQTNVPGRPGSLTTLEGEDVYDDLLLTASCFITSLDRIYEISRWLKGSGTVTFANRLGGHYQARIVNQIPFEKILRGNPHRSFAVNFRCFPFWYLDNVETIRLYTSTQIIQNPGSVYSEPVIQVFGSGDITLMVGSTIVELNGVDGSITIDSVLKEAYKEDALGTSTLQNEKMTGEFPVFRPGANAVSWTGNVNLLQITPNWRYL